MSTAATLLLLQLLLISSSQAVQLSQLVRSSGFFGAYTMRPFSDGTVLVSGFSGLKSFKQLKLHSIVTVPNPPPSLSSTILLARVYPGNSTVIWATAITTMLGNVGIAVDTADNVYAAASPLYTSKHPGSTITIIKHNPSGARLWEKYRTARGKNKFSYASHEFPRSSGLSFLPPNKLVVTAQLPSTRLGVRGNPAFVTFSSTDGRFIRLQGHPFPSNVDPYSFQPSHVSVVNTRKGPIVCYAFEVSTEVFSGLSKLYGRCARLKRANALRTRQIDVGVKTRDFFFVRTAVLEPRPHSNRQPSLFIAYERVLFTRGIKSVNELFIRRLDSDTLEDVDWSTGQSSASARPIIISLPKPNPDANSHTTFPVSMVYSRKARSVALMLWTSTTFSRFVPEAKGGGKINAVRGPTPIGLSSLAAQHWVFFFDQNWKLSPRLLDTSPVGSSVFDFDPSEMVFGREEKCLHVFGSPLMTIRNVSIPLEEREEGC